MDKRIIKTAFVVLTAILTTALMPIFAQWYHQKTGIYPIGVFFVAGFGGFGITILSILKIWGEIK